jgi:hypothetical protein
MDPLMENNFAHGGFFETCPSGRRALNETFSRHRVALRRMVDMRLDRRVQSRIDASDVVQDAFIDVVNRLNVSNFHPNSQRPDRAVADRVFVKLRDDS